MKKKKIKFASALLFLSALIVCELLSWSYIRLLGASKPGRPSSTKWQQVSGIDRVIFSESGSAKTPHPYLGYVYRQDHTGRINRYGFHENEFEFSHRDPKKIRVAIMGGSVAYFFARHLKDNKNVADLLSQKILSRKKTKSTEIDYINLAIEGFKQPQQFLAAAMFYPLFDMAIVLDGFNEITSPVVDEEAEQFPVHHKILFPEISKINSWTLFTVFLRRLHMAISNYIQPLSKRSYLVSCVERFFDLLTFRILSGNHENPYDIASLENVSVDDLLVRRTTAWSEHTRNTHEYLRRKGIEVFHIVQPNQYDAEDVSKFAAIARVDYFHVLVSKGYPIIE